MQKREDRVQVRGRCPNQGNESQRISSCRDAGLPMPRVQEVAHVEKEAVMAGRWRCGRALNHFGMHSDWVLKEVVKQDKWRCGEVAVAPYPIGKGVLFGCPWPECGFISEQLGTARRHWYTHIVDRDREFRSDHGTEAGYQYHRKVLREDACDDCAKAHRVYGREWARKSRRKQRK